MTSEGSIEATKIPHIGGVILRLDYKKSPKIEELQSVIDMTREELQVGKPVVVFNITNGTSLDSVQRAAITSQIEPHKGLFKSRCAFVITESSALTRGIVTALSWFVPGATIRYVRDELVGMGEAKKLIEKLLQ